MRGVKLGRMLRRLTRALGACALIAVLLLGGCDGGDNACVELGLKECDCCPAAQVDTCKKAIREANDRDPPDDQGIAFCEAFLAKLSSCSQLDATALAKVCGGV